MKKTRRLVIALAACALAASCAALYGCGDNSNTVPVQQVKEICGYANVGTVDRFAGVVKSSAETKVNRAADQEVKTINVKVGDKVKKGDVLFTYDTESAQLDLEKAKLELEQLNSTIKLKKNQKETLKKEKKTAPKDSKLDYTLEIQDVESDIQELKFQVQEKNNEIASMQNALSNPTVTSPISGRIQSINPDAEGVDNGASTPRSDDEDYDDYAFVSENYGDESSNDAFITIVGNESYRVLGYVNEANANQLSEGAAVIIRSRIDDTQTWGGTIAKIDWNKPASAGGGDSWGEEGDETTTSSKYPFYVKLDEAKDLMLGQHVYIEPNVGQAEAVDEDVIKLPSYYIGGLDGDDEGDGAEGELEEPEGEETVDDGEGSEPDANATAKAVEPDAPAADAADEAAQAADAETVAEEPAEPETIEAWVWAQNKNGKLEKRKVTLGEYDPYLDTYVVLSGLTMDDYIADALGDYSEGMKCVPYDVYQEQMEEEGEDWGDEEWSDDEGEEVDEEWTEGEEEEWTDEGEGEDMEIIGGADSDENDSARGPEPEAPGGEAA